MLGTTSQPVDGPGSQWRREETKMRLTGVTSVSEQQWRMGCCLRDAARRGVSQEIGGEGFRKEGELLPFPFQKAFFFLLKANDREESTSHGKQKYSNSPSSPCSSQTVLVIYFRQMKMCFCVAGSSQLKRLKAERLLQQKYLSFSFFCSCAFSTFSAIKISLPSLCSLSVGIKQKLFLFSYRFLKKRS